MNLMSSIAKKLDGIRHRDGELAAAATVRQDLELVRHLGGDHPDHGRIDLGGGDIHDRRAVELGQEVVQLLHGQGPGLDQIGARARRRSTWTGAPRPGCAAW